MEGKQRFPHLDYDLSHNLLLPRRKLFRLDQFSLIISSSYCLKKLQFLEALININFEVDDILSDDKVKDIIEKFSEMIQKIIADFFNIDMKLLVAYLKSTIDMVLERVIRFLQSARVYLLEKEIQYLIIKNLVLTTQGTVNSRMTIFNLLDKENLPTNRKYKLAARYFMGNRIVRYFFFNLSKEEKDSHSQVDIEHDIGLYYWGWQISGLRRVIRNSFFCYWGKNMENKKCRRDTQDKNFILQNIFLRAVKQHNEIGVHFLWANHISKFRERGVILLNSISEFKSKASHLNVIIYLILQSREGELIGFFNIEKFKNLMLFFNSDRFRVLFFDVLYKISSKFNERQYFHIFQNIAISYRSKNSSNIDLKFLNTFLHIIPTDKRNMLGEFQDSFEAYYELLRVAFEETNVPLVRRILNYCPRSKIFQFFLSEYGLSLIQIYVCESKYEYILEILTLYFKDSQIQEIKRMFFKLKCFSTSYAILHSGIDDLSGFMHWLSDSVKLDRINEFKKKLPFMNKGIVMKTALFCFESFRFAKAVLQWCTGEENYERSKSSILLHVKDEEASERLVVKCYENVMALVLISDWKFLNGLLKWKRYTNEEKRTLGIKLLEDSDLFEMIQNKENNLNYLYEFSKWMIKELQVKEDDKSLKTFKLNVYKNIKLYITPLIAKYDFDDVKKLILWCSVPVRKVRGLRREIQPTLQESKPDTEHAQEKYEEFNAWFNSL